MTDNEKFLEECSERYRSAWDSRDLDCRRLIAMVRERDGRLKARKFLDGQVSLRDARIAELEAQLKWATENQPGRDIKIENSPREKALESALREVEGVLGFYADIEKNWKDVVDDDGDGVATPGAFNEKGHFIMDKGYRASAAREKIKGVLGE